MSQGGGSGLLGGCSKGFNLKMFKSSIRFLLSKLMYCYDEGTKSPFFEFGHNLRYALWMSSDFFDGYKDPKIFRYVSTFKIVDYRTFSGSSGTVLHDKSFSLLSGFVVLRENKVLSDSNDLSEVARILKLKWNLRIL